MPRATVTLPNDMLEPQVIHQLKNHLSIIVGFCDLVLADMPPEDPKRADIEEMKKAGRAALDLLADPSARSR